MASIYTVANKVISLPDATTVRFILPHGSKDHLFRLDDGAVEPFKWSTDESVVDASGGFPMAAGETIGFEGPIARTEVFIRQESGGPIDMHWAYLYPSLR